MSRLLPALLALSLLGNATLLSIVARSRFSTTSEETPTRAAGPAGGASRTGTASPAPASGDLPAISPEIAAIFASRDPVRIHALLVAAGLEEELRLQIVQGMVWQNAKDRFRAIDPDYFNERDASEMWWKEPGARVRYTSPEYQARMHATQKLHEELAAEVARITGKDPNAFDPEGNPWLARQYSGLPREKAEGLHRITRDYDELEQEIRRETAGFELASDREKLRLLAAERERDIAALLTPEERAEWELRSSDTANRLRYRMGQLDATEDEYRRIYTLQKNFDDQYNPSNNGSTDPFADLSRGDPAYWDRRREAEERMEAQIRAIIGEERSTLAALESDSDFTNARAAADRLGLPAETAHAIVALREPAAAESRRIAADPKLTREQKQNALAKLAADTRASVSRTLGAEAADAYFERGSMHWLKDLESGRAIRLDPHGGYGSETIDDDPVPIIRIVE